MQEVIAFDTETNGLELIRRGHRAFMFTECDWDGKVSAYHFNRDAVSRVRAERRIRELASGKYTLVMHNAKYDLTAMELHLGTEECRHLPFHDTMMQSHVMQNNHPTHGLKEISYDLFSYPTDDEKAVQKYTKGIGRYDLVPNHIMDRYAGNDAERTMLCHRFFHPMLESDSGAMFNYKVELDLIPVTMRMERRGFMIDIERTRALIEECSIKAEQALDRVEELTGRRLNLNTPKDVIWLLYQFAGLPVINKSKKTGVPSTDKDTIALLGEEFGADHEAMQLLLQYRSYDHGATMLSSYIHFATDEGIIHPNIWTCKAITSRQSCSDPNLQNVAKAEVKLNPYPIPARRCFRPRPGWQNLHIDYKGIEMRLLVHYSGEPELIDVMYRRGKPEYGDDVHLPAVDEFYKESYWNEADKGKRKEMRDAAKNANFATPYGAGGSKVAKTLGLPLSLGMERFNNYRIRFPRLVGLTRTVIAQVQKYGFVETVFGRRLYVPKDKPYVGLNYLIQGTAAVLLKIAEKRVDDYLQAQDWNEGANLLLPIHDEIVIEWSRKDTLSMRNHLQNIRALMIDFPMFSVPLEIECSLSSRDWATKKGIDIAIA